MATTKKAKKPTATKKKPAAKKSPAKKVASKKATPKKASAKKPAAKKATKKPATRAKPAAKKSTKKPSAKKPATKKSATSSKPVKKKPAAKPVKAAPPKAKTEPAKVAAPSSFQPPRLFTPLFIALEEWANTGKLGEFDFEAYQSFNEQYKPSDWTANPDTDKIMFTFAMDGTGGQFAIWQDGSSDQLEELPVVLLGSEGSTIVLSQNVPEFFYMMAAGVDPSQLEYDGISGKEKPNVDFMVFVKKQWPGRTFSKPKESLSNAKQKLQKAFEAFITKENKN